MYPELIAAVRRADGAAAAAAFTAALNSGAPAHALVAAAVQAAGPLVNVPHHFRLDEEGRPVRVEVNHALLAVAAAVELRDLLPTADFHQALAWGVHHLAAGCTQQPPSWMAGMGVEGDLVSAILENRPGRAYRLFLSAAADPAQRPRLREGLRFTGGINLEESTNRQLRYLGHKAIFADKLLALLDYLGWEMAESVALPGIAFMATGPSLLGVYDLLWSRGLFPLLENVAGNSFPLESEDEAALVRTILRGDREHVIQHLSDTINAGVSLAAVGEAVAVAGAQLLLETMPGDWFVPLHGLTYAAANNRWVREGSSPLRTFAPCLSALLINDISPYYHQRDWLAEAARIGGSDPVAWALAAVDQGAMPEAAALAKEAAGTALISGLAARAARWGSEAHALKLAAAVATEYTASGAAGKAMLPAGLAKFLSQVPREAQSAT